MVIYGTFVSCPVFLTQIPIQIRQRLRAGSLPESFKLSKYDHRNNNIESIHLAQELSPTKNMCGFATFVWRLIIRRECHIQYYQIRCIPPDAAKTALQRSFNNKLNIGPGLLQKS